MPPVTASWNLPDVADVTKAEAIGQVAGAVPHRQRLELQRIALHRMACHRMEGWEERGYRGVRGPCCRPSPVH